MDARGCRQGKRAAAAALGGLKCGSGEGTLLVSGWILARLAEGSSHAEDRRRDERET